MLIYDKQVMKRSVKEVEGYLSKAELIKFRASPHKYLCYVQCYLDHMKVRMLAEMLNNAGYDKHCLCNKAGKVDVSQYSLFDWKKLYENIIKE